MIAGFLTIFLLSGCNGHRVGLTFKPWGYLIHADKNYRHGGAALRAGMGPDACDSCDMGGVAAPVVTRYSEPPPIKIIPQK
jgi:hypothetical protein